MRQIKVTVLIFLLYTFPFFKRKYVGIFDVTRDISSNAISFVLKNGDTDSENVSLIWRFVSDGQKTCS